MYATTTLAHQTKRIFTRSAKEKEMARTKTNKLTQIHEAIHLGWNYSSQFIAIKI
jgi:hypothetical protein